MTNDDLQARPGATYDLLRVLPRPARQRGREDLGARLSEADLVPHRSGRSRRAGRGKGRRLVRGRVNSFPGKTGVPADGRPARVPRGYGIFWQINIPLREVPVGYFLRSSRGATAACRVTPQIPPADRWRIIAYIRVLQMSQFADAPVARRREEPPGSGGEAVSTDPASTYMANAAAARRSPAGLVRVQSPAVIAAIAELAIYLGAGFANYTRAHERRPSTSPSSDSRWRT